jgi:predicted secreted protein
VKTALHTYFIILFVSLFLILPKLSEAQRIKATASLDSTHILIGDQVNLTLELEKPENIRIDFPVLADNISEYIEILRQSPVDTVIIENNAIRLVQNFLITSFDSGEHRIPPFWFKLHMEDRVDSIPSNELFIRVFTMEIDTTRGPTDIKMPYDAPLTLKEVTPWILGIILLAGIIFFIFYYISRRKRNLPVFTLPVRPKDPPHVVALRELDRIRDEKIWQKDKIKEYYSQVTDVLRTYIEDRFGIPAMEYTTHEIMRAMAAAKDQLSDKSRANLGQILPLADLVKFAKYHPLPDDHNLTLVNAYFFINDTKPAEVKQPEKPDEEDDDQGEEVILK